jgi:hypothetical protein
MEFAADAVAKPNIISPYHRRGTIMRSVIVIACSFLPLTASADDADDTLRFYLSKSDVVVLGTIKGAPESTVEEAGVPNYICQLAITDVAKGDAELKGETIAINIVRFEFNEKDRHPLIKSDAECILFLKKQSSGTQLASADYWFGVQHPSPWMFKSLRRLAREESGARNDWIQKARKCVALDKAMQQKIAGQPYDPKNTRVTKNAADGLTVILCYGSLAYDTLWTITVEMDSEAKVLKLHAELSGFE